MDYEISWESKLLIVRIAGFWDDETMARYEVAMTAALANAPPGGFGMMADLSSAPAQSRMIVDRHAATTARIVAAGCTAIGTVVPSALLRRQVDRTTNLLVESRDFSNADDARAWLLASPPL